MSVVRVGVGVIVVELGVCEGREGEVKDVHEEFGGKGVDERGRLDLTSTIVRMIHMHTKRTSAMVGLLPSRSLDSVSVSIRCRTDGGWHGINGL